MTSNAVAILLAALSVGASALPAAAQRPGEPAPKHDVVRKKAHARAAKRDGRPAAAPVAAAKPSPAGAGGGEAEASSLERRRRAFFAPGPDEGGTADAPAPPVGVTLGGSGGLTPGVGFKF